MLMGTVILFPDANTNLLVVNLIGQRIIHQNCVQSWLDKIIEHINVSELLVFKLQYLLKYTILIQLLFHVLDNFILTVGFEFIGVFVLK